MAPRKVNKSPIKPPGQKSRGSPKKVQQVLKTPSIIKLKITKESLPSATTEDHKIENVFINKDIAQDELSKTQTHIEEKIEVKVRKSVKKVISRKKNTSNLKFITEKTTNGKLTKNNDVKKRRKTKVTSQDSSNNGGLENTNGEDQCVSAVNRDFCKLMLANEVVNMQFPKKYKLPKVIQSEKILQLNNTKVKKKPIVIRKKKFKKTVLNELPSTENNQPVLKVKRCRRVPNRYLNPPEETKKPSTAITDDELNTKSDELPVKRRKNLSLNRKGVKNGLKSQIKLNGTLKQNVLNSQHTTNNTELLEKKADIENVNCKQSCLSVHESNNSWVKNISSSNTSLVTVGSEPLYIIDNKIPVLQLSNIDTDLKTLKINANVSDGHDTHDGSERLIETNYANKINNINTTDMSYPKGDKNSVSHLYSSSLYQSDFKDTLNTSQNVDGQFGSESSTENYVLNKEDNFSNTEIQCRSLNLSRSSSSSSTSSSDRSSTGTSSTCSERNISLQDNKDRHSLEEKCDNNHENINISTCYKTKLKLFLNLNVINLYQNTTEDNNGSTKILTNTKIKEIQDALFKDLSLETELTGICQSIIQDGLHNGENEHTLTGDISQFNEIPWNSSSKPSHTVNDVCKNNNNDYLPKDPAISSNVTNNKDAGHHEGNIPSKKHYSFDDNDDDDALSLFAESITEENTRRNSIFNSVPDISESEEYVPKPLFQSSLPAPTAIYQPNKIINKQREDAKQCTSICEKQNADSTSLYIDSGNNNVLQENNLTTRNSFGNHREVTHNFDETLVSNPPRLMSSIHEPIPGLKSMLFENICIFNVTSVCRKTNICNRLHKIPSKDEIKCKLSLLSEQAFIHEYMHLRTWPNYRLTSRYGLNFVEECMQRELTRILVEMTMDFIVQNQNNKNYISNIALRTEIIDRVLIYLNNVDLFTCEDLLKCPVNDGMLCDVFMRAIGISPNITRFKSIFIKLTEFIYQSGRTFDVDVAESILERIWFLPYDEMLARALLVILKSTNVKIFRNSNIEHFEKLLQSSNNVLYEELKHFKEQALLSQPVLANCYEVSPIPMNDFSRPITNLGPTEKDTRYSPDTTELASANKFIKPTFTKTINLRMLKGLNITDEGNSNSEGVQREGGSTATGMRYRKWRNCTIYDNDNFKNYVNSINAPLARTLFKRRSEENSGENRPRKIMRNKHF